MTDFGDLPEEMEGELDEEEDPEALKKAIAEKRKLLFEGVDMKDLAGDDDDDSDDFDDEDDDDGEEDEEDEDDEDDEDDDDDDLDDDDDDDDEEDAPPPKAAAGKKRAAPAPAPAPAKRAKEAAAPSSTSTATGAGWTADLEAKLKSAVSKLGPEVPNRWERIAQAVGSGKTKDACKKHAKELNKGK